MRGVQYITDKKGKKQPLLLISRKPAISGRIFMMQQLRGKEHLNLGNHLSR